MYIIVLTFIHNLEVKFFLIWNELICKSITIFTKKEMQIHFKIIEKEAVFSILPLVEKLNQNRVPFEVLKQRFTEMITQNYECLGIFDGDNLIGCCGMWFCTRHYSGKSVELDHVFIEEAYRSKGIGKKMCMWVYKYVRQKGVEAVELNAYVQNFASHKFYYNEGFNALGYHFLKKL